MLYVNKEMGLRLGAVSGVGHARLILERFGRFWGAFSVLVMLSIILTASVLLPEIGAPEMIAILVSGSVLALAVTLGVAWFQSRRHRPPPAPTEHRARAAWRMPPLRHPCRRRAWRHCSGFGCPCCAAISWSRQLWRIVQLVGAGS